MYKKETYTKFGPEWETEMMEFSKSELIGKLRGLLKVRSVTTIGDAQKFVEGTINDFENGVSDKEETINAFKDYTGALMDTFWRGALAQIKENPDLLNQKAI